MIIGGVDLGGRKAALSVFKDGQLANVAHLEVPPTRRNQELRTLGYWAWSYLQSCDFVFVEEPLIGRGVRASLQVAQTAGAVMASLPDVYIDLVPVATWKKATVGNGNAGKDDVANWLRRNYPSYATETGGNKDRIDAVCIGLYGVKVHDRSVKLDDL